MINGIYLFQPEEIITKDELKNLIKDIIENYEKDIKNYEIKLINSYESNKISESKKKCEYKYDLFIKEILSLIPESEIKEKNSKQKDLKMLYDSLWIKIN